jgi:disulfide bond formation protein DsbB
MAGAFTRLIDFNLRRWLWVALLSSALMLAIAHAFETFGGLAPCLLCLQQRDVYWTAMGVAAVGIALGFTPLNDRFERLFAAGLAVIFLVGMGISIRHAGAEWGWWPGPAACAANRTSVTAADMAKLLSGARLNMPSCEDAAWRDPVVHLSMAGWNALISLKLAFWSAVAAMGWRPGRD